MKNRTTILIKNTFILGLGQFLPKIVALITLPILTLALTTSEYGIYDLILTAEGIALPLMTLQVQQAIFRKLLHPLKKRPILLLIVHALSWLFYLLFGAQLLSEYCFML